MAISFHQDMDRAPEIHFMQVDQASATLIGSMFMPHPSTLAFGEESVDFNGRDKSL
jgi:hypothetical protein